MTEEPYIPDEEWIKVLSWAAPQVHPYSPEGLAFRRRAEDAVRFLVLGTYCLSEGNSWQDYAEAGRTFLRGLRTYDAYIEHIELQLPEYRQRPLYRPRVPPEVHQLIERFCEELSGFHVWEQAVSNVYGIKPEKQGPNAKPELHSAVASLYELWCDPNFHIIKRKKKDFINFAFEILRHGRTGVTLHSITESLKRHVQKWPRYPNPAEKAD